jgi:hypothetical protein
VSGSAPSHRSLTHLRERAAFGNPTHQAAARTDTGIDSSDHLATGATTLDQGSEGSILTSTTGLIRDPAGTPIGMTICGQDHYPHTRAHAVASPRRRQQLRVQPA